MSERFDSLRRYMPEWMAHKAVALLDALPQEISQWVQDTAQQVGARPGPPGRDAWRDDIVERFAADHRSKDQAVITQALTGAVLAEAIQLLPAPVLTTADAATADIRSTKELDMPAVKRSRILGLLEPCLAAWDDKTEALVRDL